MTKQEKIQLGLGLVGLVLFVTIATCAFMLPNGDTPVSAYTPTSRVLVTAAHLGEIEGYTCVYSDEETDVGVYLKEDYRASAPPVGAEVSFRDTYGHIEWVTAGEFAMRPVDTELVYPGCSGSPIYYNGLPIGFISGWGGNGLVRCIFY